MSKVEVACYLPPNYLLLAKGATIATLAKGIA
jgi:hypothetical protein